MAKENSQSDSNDESELQNKFIFGRQSTSSPPQDKNDMFRIVQKQYQEEMHDLLDDISMPNQSMTISNFSQISQSPFRGSTTPTRAGQFNFPGGQNITGLARQNALNLGHTQSESKLSTMNVNSKSITSLSISQSLNQVDGAMSSRNNNLTNYSQIMANMAPGCFAQNQSIIIDKTMHKKQNQENEKNTKQKQRQVYANETLGVHSSESSGSDEYDYKQIGKNINNRNLQRPNQDALKKKLNIKKTTLNYEKEGLQMPYQLGQINSAKDELDIRELSMEAENQEAGRNPTLDKGVSLMKKLQERNGKSPEFIKQQPEEAEVGPNALQQKSQISIKLNLSQSNINDQSQVITSARSYLPAFQMQFDNTPQRNEGGNKAGRIPDILLGQSTNTNHEGKQNRTFADSVLLQGMIDQQQRKRNAEMVKQEDQQEIEMLASQDSQPCEGGLLGSLSQNNFISKADMSGISSLTNTTHLGGQGGQKLFRMNMPKTPDRNATS